MGFQMTASQVSRVIPVQRLADSELDLILADPHHPLFDMAVDEWNAREEQAGEDIAAHYNRLGGRA